MPWTLREIPRPTLEGHAANYLPLDVEPGCFWRIPLDTVIAHNPETDAPITYEEIYGDQLSPAFRASGRDFVYAIRLPGHCSYWFPDMRASASSEGWTVTGDPPLLTAIPSVNAEGCYHGWLRDGVLSDDVDGRTIPEVS